jgi:lysophospholipase L1-like esterase
MRTFFFDRSLADNHPTTDAEIEGRLRTIENSGMTCLGVLHNVFNVDFNKHVVAYAGPRCQIYEFGNEPDGNGISIEDYLHQWNKTIPLLRHINPNAKFIGPVDGPASSDFLKAFLIGVKASGILPDAVSFHWYPCDQDTELACLSKASSVGQEALGVRSLVQEVLGKDLPVGITEWNFDPGNPPPSYGNNADFITQFTTSALNSMIQAGVTFACQFDAASYSGYGGLDMFNTDTNQPKPQYLAIKTLIATYRTSSASSGGHTPMTGNPTAEGPSGPLISRGKPVSCSANDDGPGGPQAIVDGHYGNWAFWHATQSSLPSWCAIHLGAGPTRVLLAWDSGFVFDYINDYGPDPQDYTIAVSPDSTNGENGTWRTVVTVAGSHTRNREHLIPFSGQSWVKMTVTKVQPRSTNHDFAVHEIDVYDVSTSANLNDTFFFIGASTTATAFNRFDENQPSFAVDAHAAFPRRFPAMLDGGVGGWDSHEMTQHIDDLLSLNPDMHYWLIGLGTNDALEQVSPEGFTANMQVIISKIKQAGHLPVISRLAYANLPGNKGIGLNREIQSLNTAIDQLTTANGLISGPDFYNLFRIHANTYFVSDGIHPDPAGAIAMNLAWFQALRPHVFV